MDIITKKEYNKLQEDIILKNNAIETMKYSFEQELKNGLGDKIKRDLLSPPKLSWWETIKIKFQRWKLKKIEKKEWYKLYGKTEDIF